MCYDTTIVWSLSHPVLSILFCFLNMYVSFLYISSFSLCSRLMSPNLFTCLLHLCIYKYLESTTFAFISKLQIHTATDTSIQYLEGIDWNSPVQSGTETSPVKRFLHSILFAPRSRKKSRFEWWSQPITASIRWCNASLCSVFDRVSSSAVPFYATECFNSLSGY